MKLHIAFDTTLLEESLALARDLGDIADILEVGSLLLHAHGIQAIRLFKEQFPRTPLLVDMKIVDRGRDHATLALNEGADWITVLAGTTKAVIHSVTSTAHDMGKKVMLDLIDASSPGQSALEAQALGIDALLFHKPADNEEAPLSAFERWDMVRGNTNLPIFISTPSNVQTVAALIPLAPAGLVVSTRLTGDPRAELQEIATLIKQS